MSAIIVTDDYLSYKDQKVIAIFFPILTFNVLFKFKTGLMATVKDGELFSGLWTLTFSLRSHIDPFAFFTALPRLSDQKIRMKFYFILRKQQRTSKILLTIILRPCKITYRCKFFLIISGDIRSTT